METWVIIALVLVCLVPSGLQALINADMAHDLRRMSRLLREIRRH